MEPKATRSLLFGASAIAVGLFLSTLAVGRPKPPEVAPAMPVAQQNKIVQQYCAVCHSDNHMHGGLSFQHFDAAHPDPSITALMIGQLTGLPFERVDACVRDTGTQCSQILDIIRGGGALNAVSTVMKDMKRPDEATTTAFVGRSRRNPQEPRHGHLSTTTPSLRPSHQVSQRSLCVRRRCLPRTVPTPWNFTDCPLSAIKRRTKAK